MARALTDRPTVVVTEPLEEKPSKWLAERAQVVHCPYTDESLLRKVLAHADGLIVRTYLSVTRDLLDQSLDLKVIGRAGVGLEHIDLAACRDRSVRVVYTPDANSQAVVEYVLALMLDALRPRIELPDEVDPQAFIRLRSITSGRQLDQLTLGIVGLGRIGRRLGRIAHAIGMNLKVCDLLPEAGLRKAVDFPFEFVDHATLYAQSDVVSIHVDGRPDNRHMIDARALKHLRPDCLLINAARGLVVDDAAMAAWARSNTEARIALDVHCPEPPPKDYPLFGLPNVRLLPHVASRTDRAKENMSWVVKDVVAVLDGDQPLSPAV